MHRLSVVSALRKLSILSTLLLVAPAVAGPVAPPDALPSTAGASEELSAKQTLERVLVRPLRESDKVVELSRRRPPPTARRVRVQPGRLSDSSGRTFFAFTIENQHGAQGQWRPGEAGCFYPEGERVFVKRGTQYVSGAFLLGRPSKRVTNVCQTGSNLAAR